jgi:hypothetical protein
MNLVSSNKLLIIIAYFLSFSVCAAPDADALFDSEEWQAAAAAYADETIRNPEDGRAWFRLAVSSRESGDLDSATRALDKAEALQFSSLRVQIERSRQEVVAGDFNAAVGTLRSVFDAGFTSVGLITNDPTLSAMSGDTAFDALVAEMSVQAYPCEHDERFSEFDFWLGEWDVRDAAGNFAGTNRIEKVEHGCLITETWTGASGSTGFSINYLDASDGKWVQIWNAAGGTQINYRGGLTDDGMRLTGVISSAAGGAAAPFRGLWAPLPDGRVRQFFEQSNDGGETWVTWFDGYYTRTRPLE